jgi:hypothetical protein
MYVCSNRRGADEIVSSMAYSVAFEVAEPFPADLLSSSILPCLKCALVETSSLKSSKRLDAERDWSTREHDPYRLKARIRCFHRKVPQSRRCCRDEESVRSILASMLSCAPRSPRDGVRFVFASITMSVPILLKLNSNEPLPDKSCTRAAVLHEAIRFATSYNDTASQRRRTSHRP